MKNCIPTIALIGLSASSALAAPVVLTAPSGLADGTKFRFIFTTTGTTFATSSSIADYNTFVNAEAAGATYNGSTIAWKAVGSTATVDARDNVGGFGTNVAVYLVNGTKVANDLTNGANGLWGGSLMAAANLGISGASVSGLAWTGSTTAGQAFIGEALGSTGNVAFGIIGRTSGDWIYFASIGSSASRKMYAVSEELTVGVIPAPGAVALLATAGLLGRRRRRG
jgi:hypothetical protein